MCVVWLKKKDSARQMRMIPRHILFYVSIPLGVIRHLIGHYVLECQHVCKIREPTSTTSEERSSTRSKLV